MPLTDLTVHDLLTAFSSNDPTPGGGSAAALASSVGASLLMMVASLPKTRSGSDEDRAALDAASGALARLRGELAAAIDADSAAYDRVVAAYKLPKATAGEQAARKTAIQEAMRGATEVPLGVMRLSAAALQHAGTVAGHGYQQARSDIGVGIAMLGAGLAGAQLNVDVNLGSLTDAEYRDAAGAAARRLIEDGRAAAAAAEALLR